MKRIASRALIAAPMLLSLACSSAPPDSDETSVASASQHLTPVQPNVRPSIHDLSAAQRAELSQAILGFLTQAIVDEHANGHDWHHARVGEQFFIKHHEYLNKLETHLRARGMAHLLPLPEWDPATPIPPEFRVVAPVRGVAQAGSMNPNPRLSLPAQFNNLCAYSDASALARAFEPWHDAVHMAVGGAMGIAPIASAAPIFWLWHGYVDDLYHDYQFRCTAPSCEVRSQVPPVAQASSSVGVVTRSGAYSSTYEAWRAFDEANSTMWISAVFQTPAWIQYEFLDGPRTITQYAINFVNGSLVSRAPKDWTLQAWNGSSWVVVDARRNETNWTGNGRRLYTVASPGRYNQYRLSVTDDNDARSGVVVVSMGRLELIGHPCQSSTGGTTGVGGNSGGGGFPACQDGAVLNCQRPDGSGSFKRCSGGEWGQCL